jgi:NADPH:quinone reductase-like Zn-dependent oxidoreductase
MKAVRIHEYGHSDRIQVEDISVPSPSTDEVLVRISAAGINPVDWKIREGFMAKAAPRELPFTLGQDFAGEVVAVGATVTGIEGSESVYGFANGTYAEYAVASPDMIASMPETVHEAIAAGLPTPGLTALQIVRDLLVPEGGQTVLIHGAAGSVGSIATQLCLYRHVRVIATASDRDEATLNGLGVWRVIDYRSERFEDEVGGLDGVIDLVGGDTLERSIGVVRRGGTIVSTVGTVDPATAARFGVRVTRMRMNKNGADLVELSRLVDRGIVTPLHTQVLPLDQARAAQDLNQSHRTSDKLILTTH